MMASRHDLFEKNPMLLKLSIAALAFIPLNFLIKSIKKKIIEKYWQDIERQVEIKNRNFSSRRNRNNYEGCQ